MESSIDDAKVDDLALPEFDGASFLDAAESALIREEASNF